MTEEQRRASAPSTWALSFHTKHVSTMDQRRLSRSLGVSDLSISASDHWDQASQDRRRQTSSSCTLVKPAVYNSNGRQATREVPPTRRRIPCAYLKARGQTSRCSALSCLDLRRSQGVQRRAVAAHSNSYFDLGFRETLHVR